MDTKHMAIVAGVLVLLIAWYVARRRSPVVSTPDDSENDGVTELETPPPDAPTPVPMAPKPRTLIEYHNSPISRKQAKRAARSHRDRKRVSTSVDMYTWNTGNGTDADFIKLLGQADVIALQEASDRSRFMRIARRHGWHVLLGEGKPGQAATPLLVAPGIRVLKHFSISILPKRYIGPGVGPDHNKPKWAIGALLEKQGVKFGAVSQHLVPSQYKALRRKAAFDQIAVDERAFAHRVFPWFIGMDANATPKSPVLRSLYGKGWTSNAREGGILPTHGNRAIDYWFWLKSSLINFVSVRTVKTRSDHDALGMTVRISN